MYEPEPARKIITVRLSEQRIADAEYIREHGPEPGWFQRGGRTRTYAIEKALEHYAKHLRKKASNPR